MPDKRQTSKQRRAARNRAQREALAARRENAATPTRNAVTTSGSSRAGANSKASAGSARGTATAAPVPSGPRPPGLAALKRENRRAGDLAVLIALALAIGGFFLLLGYKVPVDDRGDAVPAQYGGLALNARSAITGHNVEAGKESVISLYGFGIIAILLVPVVVMAVVNVLNLRVEQRSRLLTIGMVVVAGVVFLTGAFGVYYLPSLIALAVASFQVRKVELPQRQAQMAAREADRPARRRGRGRVVDVEEVEPEDVEVEDATPEPTPRARNRRSRASRRATTAQAEAVEPEAVDPDEVELVSAEPEDAPADEVADAEPAPEAKPAPATDDDILAELEEELRRESEADNGEDGGPTR